MSKALFLNIPAHGHVNPSLPLVAELVKRGEQVVYVNTEEFRKPVESAGAQFVPYPPENGLKELLDNASRGDLTRNALALVQIGENLLPSVRQLIEAEKPDYVIYDSLAGWGKMGAQLYKLPTIATISTFAVSMDALPPMTPGALFTIFAGFARRMPKYWQLARRIRQAYGVRPVSLTEALMCLGDLNIVFTSRDFQPGASHFGDSFKFVGPSIGARPPQADFPFDLLTSERPIIYISLGTINNQNLVFYRQCFEAFGGYPAQVVLSAGKQTDIAALGAVPQNFIVRDFVPQLEVLERTQVFITHGGLNSVHEALMESVPMVVIPQHVEQAIVARQITSKGAGVALGDKPPFGRVTGAELRQAVERVLGPEHKAFKQKAQQLGDSLRQAGGSARAAEEILAFVRSRAAHSSVNKQGI